MKVTPSLQKRQEGFFIWRYRLKYGMKNKADEMEGKWALLK
jgi:hypothetical protein